MRYLIHTFTHQNKTKKLFPKNLAVALALSFFGGSMQSLYLHMFNFWT